jgi:superfamily II DNA or RNA helicase
MNYNYQKPLVENVCRDLKQSGKTVVLAACPGAGKTHMASDVIDELMDDDSIRSALIFAHGQTILRGQWEEVIGSKLSHYTSAVVTKGKLAKRQFKESQIIIAIPQTLAHAEVQPIDLLVVDEAHQRFLARQMQELLTKLKPKYVLLLTGTPSHYLMNPVYKVHGVTIEELLPTGAVIDPLIEIVRGADQYAIEDYDKSTWQLKEGHMKEETTTETLNGILPQILRKITSRHRANPKQFEWAKEVKSWKALADKMHKSMVICNDQAHANDVFRYFSQHGIKCVLSISNNGTGEDELRTFKTDPSVRLFIVVNRGNMGFNFEELFNEIDLSGTHNVNRLFQMLCRIVRPSRDNPHQKKLFIKVTNHEMQRLTFAVMSFVVALSTKRYYYTYTTQHRIDKVLEIPVPARFMDHLDGDDPIGRVGDTGNDSELPELLTFTEVSNPKKIGTIAYTNLTSVIKRIYRKKQNKEAFTIQHLEHCMRLCKSRKEFATNHPSEFAHMRRMRLLHLMNLHYGGRNTWSRKLVWNSAKECLTFKEFHERFPGAYAWAKKNGELQKIEEMYNFAPKELDIATQDDLIHRIIEDVDYDISETGNVFYKEEHIKPKYKRGFVPYIVHSHDRFRINVPIPRLVYTKFNGPVPEGKQIAFKVVAKRSPFMSSLQNMYLVKKKDVA